MCSARSFTDTGRESALPSAHRVSYLKDKPRGGAETSVWQSLLSQAVLPLHEAFSHWSGELTNQQPGRRAENTASDTCRMYTGRQRRYEAAVQQAIHMMTSCAVRLYGNSTDTKSGEDIEKVQCFFLLWIIGNNIQICRDAGRHATVSAKTSGEVHTCSRTDPRHTFLQPRSAHCSRVVCCVIF